MGEISNFELVTAGDENSAIRLDCAIDSDALVVSFAAIPGEDGRAAFAFVRLLSVLPAKRAFFRDPQVQLYQGGLPGVGNTTAEIAEYIKRLCIREKIKRVIMLGNSVGGYAAILFGILTNAHEVHAIAPRTRFVDGSDVVNARNLEMLFRLAGKGNPTLDLRELHLKEKPRTKIYLYYPTRNRLDKIHALHMEGLPGVTLAGYPFSGHTLARYLVKSETLKNILEASLIGRDDLVRETIRRSIVRSWFSGGGISFLTDRMLKLVGKR